MRIFVLFYWIVISRALILAIGRKINNYYCNTFREMIRMIGRSVWLLRRSGCDRFDLRCDRRSRSFLNYFVSIAVLRSVAQYRVVSLHCHFDVLIERELHDIFFLWWHAGIFLYCTELVHDLCWILWTCYLTPAYIGEDLVVSGCCIVAIDSYACS